MMNSNEPTEGLPIPEFLQPLYGKYQRYARLWQYQLDRTAPQPLYRWLGTALLNALFLLRIVFAQGWYIVCYAHAIYLLNLLLAFLQPKFDPSLEQDLAATNIEEGGEEEASNENVSNGYGGRGGSDDEFRPFIRRLPEWQFWLSATRATIISVLCTVSTIFDIPVYWPILLVYFCALFAITMKRQIRHMIKYKYIPFDFVRKERYGGSGKRGNIL